MANPPPRRGSKLNRHPDEPDPADQSLSHSPGGGEEGVTRAPAHAPPAREGARQAPPRQAEPEHPVGVTQHPPSETGAAPGVWRDPGSEQAGSGSADGGFPVPGVRPAPAGVAVPPHSGAASANAAAPSGEPPPGAPAPATHPSTPAPGGGSGHSGADMAAPEPAPEPSRQRKQSPAVSWTPDAKTLRAQLAAWHAARRKAQQRAADVVWMIRVGRVPVADAWGIVCQVAESTGEPLVEVARAAGFDVDDA